MTQFSTQAATYGPLVGTPTTLYTGQRPYDGSAARIYRLRPDTIAVREKLSADQVAAAPWTSDSTALLVRE